MFSFRSYLSIFQRAIDPACFLVMLSFLLYNFAQRDILKKYFCPINAELTLELVSSFSLLMEWRVFIIK